MVGTLINVAAILAGSLIGLLLRGDIKQKFQNTVMQGLALCVMLIGVSGALKTTDSMIVIVSVVLGALAGEGIDIERHLENLGARAQRVFSGNGGDQSFAQGFVTASLVYCVGAMAIVGAMDSGLRGDHSTLIAKSALDGVSAVIFASTMGPGVMLSALAVFLYQGMIAVFAQYVAPFLTELVISEMAAVGGLLILGIGLNMMNLCKVRVGNLLPAMFMPIVVVPLMHWIEGIL